MSFDPLTLLIAGVGASAFGSMMQGAGQAASAEYNAQVAGQNAVIARQQAQAAVEAQQRNAARTIGTMVANYGASGVQSDVGSPMDVLADSARLAELDKLTLQYNYALKAAGYESQKSLDLMGAETATTSSLLNAGGSVLRGAAVYSSFPSSGGSAIPMFGAATGPGAIVGGVGASPY